MRNYLKVLALLTLLILSVLVFLRTLYFPTDKSSVSSLRIKESAKAMTSQARSPKPKAVDKKQVFKEPSKSDKLANVTTIRAKLAGFRDQVLNHKSKCEAEILKAIPSNDFIDVEYEIYRSPSKVTGHLNQTLSGMRSPPSINAYAYVRDLVYSGSPFPADDILKFLWDLEVCYYDERASTFLATMMEAAVKYNWRPSQTRPMVHAFFRLCRDDLLSYPTLGVISYCSLQADRLIQAGLIRNANSEDLLSISERALSLVEATYNSQLDEERKRSLVIDLFDEMGILRDQLRDTLSLIIDRSR